MSRDAQSFGWSCLYLRDAHFEFIKGSPKRLWSTWQKRLASCVNVGFSDCRVADSAGDGTWLRRGRWSVDQEPGPFVSIASCLRLRPAGIRTQLSPLLLSGPCPGWAAVRQLYRTLEAGTGPGENDPIRPQLRGLPGNILCHTISWEVRGYIPVRQNWQEIKI